MGNCISYLHPDNDLGEISKGRWRVMKRLLEVFLDYVNDAVQQEWAGNYHNVVIDDSGTTPPVMSEPAGPLPQAGPFTLGGILEDWSNDIDEIIFIDAAELKRLLAWADFLKARDGAFAFFNPLVDTLRQKTSGIDQYLSGNGSASPMPPN